MFTVYIIGYNVRYLILHCCLVDTFLFPFFDTYKSAQRIKKNVRISIGSILIVVVYVCIICI